MIWAQDGSTGIGMLGGWWGPRAPLNIRGAAHGLVKTPLRPWVKTRGRMMSDSQGGLLCFHLTCLTERSFLPLLPVLEISLPTGGTSGEESSCQCMRRKRCRFDPWPGNIPWRRKWQPTPVFLLGESRGWRSLVGCNPWGHWESDTTERLHFHFSLSCTGEGNGNPLQCSCLENPRDWGACWAAIYGIAQSRTRLKRLSSSSGGVFNHRI